MKSRDPWALIVTDPWGDVVIPPPCYSHPFYREVPGCGDALVGGWTATTGVNMNTIGAELTALSAPGYGPYGPWFVRPDVYLGRGSIGAELTALSAPGYGPYGPWFYRPYGTYGVFDRPYGTYGMFVGADATPSASPAAVPVAPPVVFTERKGLTKELAPIVAPATGGIMVRKHLDDKHVLHVEICVDEKCYSASVDIAPVLAMVAKKKAAWHAQYTQQSPPSAVVSTVQDTVGAAEDFIVQSLVAQHVDTIAAGILGDIASAVKGAVTGVARGVSRGVASTFRKLKGPIGAAAGIAAAAGASAIPGVGIVAAPLAAKLANDLVQAAAGDPAAQSAVTQAAQQAQSDPAVASALDQATQAVANSTAAYHVEDTAKRAARGDVGAQREIVQVADDVEAGDPAAKAVAALVAQAMKSEWGANLWEQITGRGPGTITPGAPVVGAWGYRDTEGIVRGGYREPGIVRGGYRMPFYGGYIVGAALDDMREKARAHAVTKPGTAAGVLITVDGRLHGRGFRNLDDAIDWLQHITRNRAAFTYAAAYEKDAAGNAYIQGEELGGASQPAPAPTPIPRDAPATTSGW